MSTTTETTATVGTAAELTDGYHLVVDALKLNDVRTIYGVVGIPITDVARVAQASGVRYIGFRHESDAGHAAAAAGFLTKRPGICLTVSAPGFLNGLEDIGLGISRAIRTAVSGRPGGVYLDIPAAVLGEVVDAATAAASLTRV